jgi:hypothetical protein
VQAQSTILHVRIIAKALSMDRVIQAKIRILSIRELNLLPFMALGN